MGNCDEGKGTTSKITKSMCCSFDTDIKLTVIKPATAQWHGNSVLQNGTWRGGQNRKDYYKSKQISTSNVFCGLK